MESRYGIPDLTLLEILTMKIDHFRDIFRKSPIKRLKLRGLLRNACVVAGNLDSNSEWLQSISSELRSPLRNALLALVSHEEAMVRPHAIWALFRLYGREIGQDIEPLLDREQNELARDEFDWWERRLGETSESA